VIFVLGFVFVVTALGFLTLAIPRTAPELIFRGAGVLIMLIAALSVGWLCGRQLEGLPFRALGASFRDGWLIHLFAGLLLGAGTIGLAALLAVVFGGLRFEVNPIDSALVARGLATSFLFLAVAAASEEALFRGYPFQTLVRSGLAWLAIAITSVFFSIVHLNNPNAGAISLINTALAGLWFGIAYLKTKDLWFVLGLHLMWNWVQGAVFGIEISGLTDLTPVSILREIDSGPSWLTGDTYGLEGGIVTTVALLASTILIRAVPWLRPRDISAKASA
jgi:membrane protease YdiL (CAAX protease family)